MAPREVAARRAPRGPGGERVVNRGRGAYVYVSKHLTMEPAVPGGAKRPGGGRIGIGFPLFLIPGLSAGTRCPGLA